MKAPSTIPTAYTAAGPDAASERRFILDVLRAEADAIAQLESRLGQEIHRAVDLMHRCADQSGSVIVTGLGKSGLIGKKISATLASLGVHSHDVHPSEAMHGDLGRIRSVDCILALSNSGETDEVVRLVSILKQDGVPIISITGGTGGSSLARLATVALCLGQITEASDLGLAPTCSTTATLALGDALALAVARRRAFTADEFAKRHPGGTLGGLLRPVTDALRFSTAKNLCVIDEATTVRSALQNAQGAGRRPGALIIVDASGRMSGLFTDGDLRRLIVSDPSRLDQPIREVMTRNPKSLPDSALIRDAVHLVLECRPDEIPIVDTEGRPVGLLDVQDLVAMKVVQD